MFSLRRSFAVAKIKSADDEVAVRTQKSFQRDAHAASKFVSLVSSSTRIHPGILEHYTMYIYVPTWSYTALLVRLKKFTTYRLSGYCLAARESITGRRKIRRTTDFLPTKT